jgi:hypothetical protein
MSDPRHNSDSPVPMGAGIERTVEEDLDALRRLTARDLPTLEQSAQAARSRPARAPREGFMLRSFRSLVLRPWLATAIGVAVVALILLAIPFSYSQTTGYEVRLRVPSPGPGDAATQQIVDRIRDAFHVESVSISTGDCIIFSARLPLGSRPRIQQGFATLAPTIASLGPSARTEILPIVERVSGTVYAMATKRIVNIHIDREGKSLDEIEAELRDQLAAEGLPGADVQVTQEGDETRMQMTWQAAPGDTACCSADINVTMDGLPTGERKMVRVKADHPLTDAEMKDEIERQLREQGMINPVVEIRDGKVVSVRHD